MASQGKTSINESKYIRDLKKQIVKLKQENSALKKKNRVMAVTYDEYIEALRELEDNDAKNWIVVDEDDNTEPCPKCKESTQPFLINDAKFYKCNSCGSKGRL